LQPVAGRTITPTDNAPGKDRVDQTAAGFAQALGQRPVERRLRRAERRCGPARFADQRVAAGHLDTAVAEAHDLELSLQRHACAQAHFGWSITQQIGNHTGNVAAVARTVWPAVAAVDPDCFAL